MSDEHVEIATLVAALLPPADRRPVLTAEQRDLWHRMGMDRGPLASGDQTAEQAENLAILSFRYWCNLDGLRPIPDEATVRALLRGAPVGAR